MKTLLKTMLLSLSLFAVVPSANAFDAGTPSIDDCGSRNPGPGPRPVLAL